MTSPPGGRGGISGWAPEHTRLLGNLIHDSGGGINIAHGDHHFAEGNVLHHNAYTNPYQTSGISVWEPNAADDEPGFHIVIRNNVSYSNENKVQGDGKVGPEVSDGNGIIDSFRATNGSGARPDYVHGALVENNLVYDNAGAGIRVFLSDHVTVRHNTAYGNYRATGPSGTYKGELSNQDGSHNIWVNNIAVSTRFTAANTAILDGDSKQDVIWKNNLTWNGTPGDASIKLNNTSTKIDPKQNLLGVDPSFGTDFKLSAGSPALGAGTGEYGAPDDDLMGRSRAGRPLDLGAIGEE